MKYYTVVFVSLINSVSVAQAQVPDQMTPSQQLVAACKSHPGHEICLARQAKKDKATQARHDRVMRQVLAVQGMPAAVQPSH